ncbi:MAG: hypothetical protein AMXMBFR23_28040 [Chloroflexota bacterium]
MAQFQPNTLYYGDNLGVLRDFPSECVDLVYLDPPFNSNRSYNVLFKEAKGAEAEAQIEAFGDTWSWGLHTSELYEEIAARGDDVGRLLQAFVQALGHNDVTAYLTMMAPRLVELRRVMKPTASIYLHCDPTASHYLKVIMDAVFGGENFRNEIIWERTTGRKSGNQYGRVHDVLLLYGRSERSTWNPQVKPQTRDTVRGHDLVVDDVGVVWRYSDLSGAGPGPARRFGDREIPPPPGRHWQYDQTGIDQLWAAGRIVFSRGGQPRLRTRLEELPGVDIRDVWTDIRPINAAAAERLGYPTQKPEALLERIIAASSNEGDIVLDPFCGCGTATVAAHRLGRRWIGIDITYLAVDLMRRRLLDTFPGDFPDGIHVDGDPADEAAALALAERDKFQFQFWAVAKLGGVARGGENRKGMDRGVDGVATFPEQEPDDATSRRFEQVIISVKGGGTGVKDVRDLVGTITREKAAIGVLVTVREPTSEMKREAGAAGIYRSAWDGSTYPRIQIITAGEIVHGTRIDMPSQRGTSDFTKARAARERADKPRLL